MEHVTITKEGEYFRMTPDKGYLLKNTVVDNIYNDVITKNTNLYIVVKV